MWAEPYPLKVSYSAKRLCWEKLQPCRGHTAEGWSSSWKFQLQPWIMNYYIFFFKFDSLQIKTSGYVHFSRHPLWHCWVQSQHLHNMSVLEFVLGAGGNLTRTYVRTQASSNCTARNSALVHPPLKTKRSLFSKKEKNSRRRGMKEDSSPSPPPFQLSVIGRSAPYLRRNLLWLWSTDHSGGRWRGCMLLRKCCLQRRSSAIRPCRPRLARVRTTFKPWGT